MTLNSKDFDYIRKLVLDRSAIALDAGKGYLVEQRLGDLVRRQGLTSLSDLVAVLRMRPAFSDLHRQVVEAMTTNETSFFRDVYPFEALRRHVLPELIEKRAAARTLNLWCAAAATGQEPYSVAMLLSEHFPALAAWRVNFIATDLARDVLARAREGRYSGLEVARGLPPPLLAKYFEPDGAEYRARAELRRRVEFREMNLAEAWSPMPKMDIILMRNVLIYFTVETKRQILGKARLLLQPDGYLFLGSAETTLNLDDNFERVQFDRAGCYRLKK